MFRRVFGDRADSNAVGRSSAESFLWERSEEHTSELQSRLHLVCRLLLEKKKLSMNVIAPAGRPSFSPASLSTFTIAALDWMASEPPRSTTALPDLRHSEAASAVTFVPES